MSSPQAVGLRTRRSTRLVLESLSNNQKGAVTLGPRIVTANGEVFQKLEGAKVLWREMQNCGVVPIKYLIDNDNDCTTNNFHGILAAGSAADDGLGSIRQFNITSDRVTIFVDSGSPRLSVLEIVIPET